VADALDAVVVPAERPGQALIRRGFPSRVFQTIPWGVPAPQLLDRAAARAELRLPDDALMVACVANFTRAKGHALVVRAVARLRSRFPTLRAVFAGDGPDRLEVVALCRQLGVDDIVDLPGELAQPWPLLRAADVFALASDIEGLPLAVLEALSQGTPVVATDVGGMPEAVIPGVTGSLVPPQNVDALAAALGDLLGNPALRQRMGSAARARYEERYTLAAMLRSHEALYEHVVARSVTRD
jgi:glycosyltransferase involved in cell wall biosynthesis